MLKINNKKVNKIVINNREVLKVVIDGNVKYTNTSGPFYVTLNSQSLLSLGTTGTGSSYSTGIALSVNSNAMNNVYYLCTVNDTNYNYPNYIAELNRSISGQPNTPYDTRIQAGETVIDHLYIGPNSGSFYVCWARIYNDSGTLVDEISMGSISQGNSQLVQLTTPIHLSGNTTYYIKAYGRTSSWGSNGMISAKVYFEKISAFSVCIFCYSYNVFFPCKIITK